MIFISVLYCTELILVILEIAYRNFSHLLLSIYIYCKNTFIICRNRDASPKGHVLHSPQDRLSSPNPEMANRSLNSVTQAVLRTLTHLALLVGLTAESLKTISALVQDGPQNGVENNLREFLWQHLRADLFVLQRALGRNLEECLITMHLLLRDLYLNPGAKIDYRAGLNRFEIYVGVRENACILYRKQ